LIPRVAKDLKLMHMIATKRVGLSPTQKAKVTAVAAAVGVTFEFGPSTIGKGWIRAMEGLVYFAKGNGRAPGAETVPHIPILETKTG
jgi:hypothetical protein